VKSRLKEKVSVLPEITEKLKTYKIEEGDEQGLVLRNAGEEKALRDRERRALERLQALFGETAVRLREVVSTVPATVDEARPRGSRPTSLVLTAQFRSRAAWCSPSNEERRRHGASGCSSAASLPRCRLQTG
jgi:hypothetical protein